MPAAVMVEELVLTGRGKVVATGCPLQFTPPEKSPVDMRRKKMTVAPLAQLASAQRWRARRALRTNNLSRRSTTIISLSSTFESYSASKTNDGCNNNCINRDCDAFGFCIQGCVDGYWGDTCDSVCPVTCIELSCNKITGHCVTCISGYWGDTCTLLCSSFCYGGVCDKTNGKCTLGCAPGRNGEICDRICSSGCKYDTCNQQSGICLKGCKQNWSGDYCNRIYDTAEENAGYQELGQVSGPSHYDQLQRSQTE
uniref:Scavenger receptor class F member 2 n=1 Tax=Magallana gigas TaxID=29159 RepID=K1Q420_MAGGI